MAITVNSAITPTLNRPSAQAIDVNAVALQVANYSPYKLDLSIGSGITGSVQPYETALFTGIPVPTSEPWVFVVPRAAYNINVPSGASNSVTVTTYASGDVLPAVGSYSPAPLTNGVPLRLQPRLFGAYGNGVNDDTAVLQALIDAAGVMGGARIDLGYGTYLISSTLTIGNGVAGTPSTVNGVIVAGDGISSTVIKWGGAAAGTMISIKGICNGNALANLTVDGAGIAGIGCLVTSGQYAGWGDLVFQNTTIAGLKLTTNASGAGTNNSLGNRFGKLVFKPSVGTGGQQSYGLVLDGSAANSSDANNNDFPNVHCVTTGNFQTGIRLGFADFNNFGVVNCFSGGTSSFGLELDGTVKANFPANNYFIQLAPGYAPNVHGTVGNNWVQHYDTIDGGGLPIPSGTGLLGFADNPGGGGVLLPFGIGAPPNVQVASINFQLPDTGAHNFAVPIGSDGLYLAILYLRQTNAAAVTVTAAALVTDDTGLQTHYFQGSKAAAAALTGLQAASLAQGSYTSLPLTLRYVAAGGQKPVIQLTASVANVVFGTVAILKIA